MGKTKAKKTVVNDTEAPSLTILELKEKIQTGVITVDFGVAFLLNSNPMEILIEKLDEYEEWATKCEKIKGTVRNHQIWFHPDNVIAAVVQPIPLHSWITGGELRMSLNDNKITFVENIQSSEVITTSNGFKFPKFITVAPRIPDDIADPIKFELPVPSKSLLFKNCLPPDVSVEPENKYSKEFSLQGLMGQRNLTQHYAALGVGFGQTSNMSVYIYSNGSEIILSGHNYAHGGGYGEETDAEIAKIEEYAVANKMKLCGEISCEVWRWECIDAGTAKKKGVKKTEQFDDMVTVKLKGNNVRVEHYMNTIAESKISKEIVSHFWIQ